MNSGRSSRWRFQTHTRPSGSDTADGFLLYEATLSSGNCTDREPSGRFSQPQLCHEQEEEAGREGRTFGDQSRPVTERFFVQRSSSNVHTSLTFRPSSPSLQNQHRMKTLSGNQANDHTRSGEGGNSQAAVPAERIILDVVVPVAQRALDDPGRALDKLEKGRGRVDLTALLVRHLCSLRPSPRKKIKSTRRTREQVDVSIRPCGIVRLRKKERPHLLIDPARPQPPTSPVQPRSARPAPSSPPPTPSQSFPAYHPLSLCRCWMSQHRQLWG